MADISPPSISTWVVLAARVLLAVILRLLTTPIRWLNGSGAATFFEDIFFTIFRTALRHSSFAVSRAIFKPTTEVYEELCRKTGREARSLLVDGKGGEGVKAHWIGDEEAEVVVLYLHGGGYTQPASPDHLTYLDGLAKDMNIGAGGASSISFLVLAYSLAPDQAVYPTQLRQAAATFNQLVNVRGRSPSSIILAGDSAGGALVLALLSHILHPKAGVPRVELQVPLRGAMLFSPWVSFSTAFDSYTRNAESDTLSASFLKKWATMYLGEMDAGSERQVTWDVKSNDVYAEAYLADPRWWGGLNQVVGSMLVWVGGKELLHDAVTEFASKLKKGWKSRGGLEDGIIVVEGRDEAHIGPILNVSLGNKGKRGSQVAIEAWLLERLNAVSNKSPT
ncbi:alpha/beta-hydrolase [Karstenula rhodostoma CBS 690.94]|uniref:Alpha/beta-hydrolase n=1 Tax=Karstenula rhodostoma CBS 690.94 TaxID=1392251 RepID=A0A9P4PQU3_9PLEO|nr:alpha/beta-hydrolase [Karstenula rhodostoma CBS 690.94]